MTMANQKGYSLIVFLIALGLFMAIAAGIFIYTNPDANPFKKQATQTQSSEITPSSDSSKEAQEYIQDRYNLTKEQAEMVKNSGNDTGL